MTVMMAPVADRPECAHVLNVAFYLPISIDAQIVGYHLHPQKFVKERE